MARGLDSLRILRLLCETLILPQIPVFPRGPLGYARINKAHRSNLLFIRALIREIRGNSGEWRITH